MERRLATVHARGPEGLQPLQLDPTRRREFFSGGGGLHSTAGDYLTFLRMLLAGGQRGQPWCCAQRPSPSWMQNHIGPLLVEPMRSAVPASSNDVELFAGMPKKWGLSFLINTEAAPGGRSAGSLAWAGLFNSYSGFDPAAGVAGVLMTQVLPVGDRIVLDLLDRFEEVVYRKLTTRKT